MSKWSQGAEGFICPYCLVSFASSNRLQAHFIDFHSNEGSDAAVVVEPDTGSDEINLVEDRLGHVWKPVTLAKPEKCEACAEIIWSSSYICQVCEMVIHAEKCQDQVTKICKEPSKNETESKPQHNERGDSGESVPPPVKGIPNIVKRQVAKGRQRFVDEEFDLDLSYITDRVIAMSFPASGVETAYRNNLKDVAKMLKSRHDENYLIFNLSERSYDISRFNNQVLDFGWPDHLAPSLERLSIVCRSMKSWLESDPQHVVVVHCKGGKGRTGCVIAAFMHYSKICQSADDALDHFAMKRFYDDKLQGVTQPSQRRYVHYFEDMLAGKVELESPPIKLSVVMIHGIPNFDGKGGCRPFIKIYQNMKLVHTSGLYVCSADKERVKITLYGGLKLEGEILIKCIHKRTHGGVDSIFRCQFHHAIVNDYRMVFGKNDLDDSFKDKRFGDGIKVELIFEKINIKSPVKKSGVDADIRQSLLLERGINEPSLEEKRDSYQSFEGGYDHGKPQGEDLIQFDDDKSRSDRAVSVPMDPELIERVKTDNGNIYTVISKDDPPGKQPSGAHKRVQPNKGMLVSSGSHKYSHLVHASPVKPNPPTKPPVKPKAELYAKLGRTPERKPYDDVTEKQLVLTPISRRESEMDNEMWMAVKWQTLPPIDRNDSISSSQRSSSQTALDELGSVEVYSNVTDIATGNIFIAQQRRHSFTEGDSSIIITSPSSDHTHNYDAHIYGNDETIYTIPPDADVDNDYSEVKESDYVNTGAELIEPPSYENREEIRQRMLQAADSKPAKVTVKELPPSSVKDMILEGLRFKKPDTVTVIQSSSLSQTEKKQTLGMFNFSDNRSSRLQVGRGDYEKFSLDSWNSSPSPAHSKPRPSPPTRPPDRLQSRPKPLPPLLPPPQIKQIVKSPPTTNNASPQLPTRPSRSSSSIDELNDKSKAFVRPHLPLSQVKSQPHVESNSNSKRQSPSSTRHSPLGTRKQLPSGSHDSDDQVKASKRPAPPPKPAPYRPVSPASIIDVKELQGLWYKPNITRDEAIRLVRTMSPGSFIVRDSQTVSGGYALTIKVDKDLVRQRKKLDGSVEITDDMCVNHFLIQPDPEGVKLQGWAESSFKSLPEFISRHTEEKLCLPCVLRLPNRGDVRSKRKPDAASGAACDLILLGTVDVPGAVGDLLISDAVQQLAALDLPVMSVVNFKASNSGVTITESANGVLNKRSYPLHTISYCALDPNDTKWDAPLLGDNVRNKSCFGFIHRAHGSHGHSCLLFAELDASSPVVNVVAYMKRLLKK